MAFETLAGLLGTAIFGGIGLVCALMPDRVVAWARQRLSPGPTYTEASFVRNFVLGPGYRGYIVLVGFVSLLGALLLVTWLIWGELPTQHTHFRDPGEFKTLIDQC